MRASNETGLTIYWDRVKLGDPKARLETSCRVVGVTRAPALSPIPILLCQSLYSPTITITLLIIHHHQPPPPSISWEDGLHYGLGGHLVQLPNICLKLRRGEFYFPRRWLVSRPTTSWLGYTWRDSLLSVARMQVGPRTRECLLPCTPRPQDDYNSNTG